MNIAIIDKYPMLRLGVKSLLGTYFQQVTFTEHESVDSIETGDFTSDFDLIILGMGQDPASDDIAALKKLKKLYPLTKLIVYDEKPQLIMVPVYFKAGLHGYIAKQADPTELIDCIRQVMNHQRYVSVEIIDLTLEHAINSTGRSDSSLSPRENQIARFLCEGMSTSAIAEALDRKPSTISTIKFNIFQKMQVKDIIKLRERFVLAKSQW